MKRSTDLREKILAENQRAASELRMRFEAEGTLVVNLISSPGSGKTTLLGRTIELMRPDLRCAVLVGDVATELDAVRLRNSGARAHQICTGGACHLDASMVERALDEAGFGRLDLLFIENVGNLICPTSFDLGEHFKVALLSVAEGTDKVLKYPALFRKAAVTLLCKMDLRILPEIDFCTTQVRKDLQLLNPGCTLIELSARTGEGLDAWISLLERKHAHRIPGAVREQSAHQNSPDLQTS